MSKIKVILDMDKGRKKWNEKNPEKRQMRKYDFDQYRISKGTLFNWENGKIPNAITQIFSFLNDRDLKLEDVLTVTDENGKSLL